MTAEDLFVDDCNNRQTVETVRKRLPQLDTVPSLTYTQYTQSVHSLPAPISNIHNKWSKLL